MANQQREVVAGVKRVALVSHLKKKQAHILAGELIQWLENQGLTVKVPVEDSTRVGWPQLGTSEDEIVADLDLLVSLGGDGTFLRAAGMLAGSNVPILGVNLGRFGFLSQIEVDELYPTLIRVLAGDHGVEKRMMLDCRILKDGKEQVQKIALNEAAVTRGPEPKLLELHVQVNNEDFHTYASDGLIVATPTGSTAYSLSAGGPIVAPRLRVMVMTSICPHALFDRTLILAEDDVVKIQPRFKKNIVASVDGEVISTPHAFDVMEVSVSSASLSLVKPLTDSFYRMLKRKLNL